MEEGMKVGYNIDDILREMRDEYWQGLETVEEALEEQLECVTFTLGGETYAFETVHAAEVLRIPRLVKVPKVQELIVGVFNLRGEIVAAMDIRSLLGLPQLPFGPSGRIIVVKGEKFHTGLLVESVKGVTALPLDTFEVAVKSLSGAQRDYLRGQLQLPDGLVILLDIKRLLAAPEILVDNG